MRTLTDATRPDELTLLREDGLYALVSASTPPDVLALALEALAAHAGPPGRVDLVVHHRPTVTVRRPEERAECPSLLHGDPDWRCHRRGAWVGDAPPDPPPMWTWRRAQQGRSYYLHRGEAGEVVACWTLTGDTHAVWLRAPVGRCPFFTASTASDALVVLRMVHGDDVPDLPPDAPEERAEVTPLPLIRVRCPSTFGVLTCDLPTDHDGPHQDHRRARSWTVRRPCASTWPYPPGQRCELEHGHQGHHRAGGCGWDDRPEEPTCASCLHGDPGWRCHLPTGHQGPHMHGAARWDALDAWVHGDRPEEPTISLHHDWTMSTPPRHQWTREHGRDVWHVDGGPCPTIPGSPYVRPYPPPHVRCHDCSEWLHRSG